MIKTIQIIFRLLFLMIFFRENHIYLIPYTGHSTAGGCVVGQGARGALLALLFVAGGAWDPLILGSIDSIEVFLSHKYMVLLTIE